MRQDRYRRALEEATADAFVLTSEPAVQHAAGVRLYTQRLIPQRPIVCVIAPPKPLTVVAVEYEREQLATEHPDLEVVTFREFRDNPWEAVAELLDDAGARRVLVEETISAGWLGALEASFEGAVEVSRDAPGAARVAKDADEIARLEEGSLAAERAIAGGAQVLREGVTENDVAGTIAVRFVSDLGPRASEVLGICIGPQYIGQMHHVGGADPLPAAGPVRLGIVGRIDGYWILLTRMLVMGEDPAFEAVYECYVDAYLATMATLRPGASPHQLYSQCAETLAAAGFDLTSSKIGHGTGLDFLERPYLSADDPSALESGTVLAYDYGTGPKGGYVLHLEDRILVAEEGPRRLSARWDLRDVRNGYAPALE